MVKAKELRWRKSTETSPRAMRAKGVANNDTSGEDAEGDGAGAKGGETCSTAQEGAEDSEVDNTREDDGTSRRPPTDAPYSSSIGAARTTNDETRPEVSDKSTAQEGAEDSKNVEDSTKKDS